MAKKTKITPLGDRVLVRRLETQEEVGGIIIPDSAKEKPQEAEVVALGTGSKDGEQYSFSVKVGDTVLISKYGGTEVKLNEQEHMLLREDDILGVIA